MTSKGDMYMTLKGNISAVDSVLAYTLILLKQRPNNTRSHYMEDLFECFR